MARISALHLVTTSRRRQPPTILVVDDDVALGRTLATPLEVAGYGVRIAPTGRAACALVRRVRPDLIILDLMLPDTDGLALMTTVRPLTDAAIIICSARDGQVDRVLGRRLGAADFVAKRIDLDDLQARIEAVLPGVRMSKERSPNPSVLRGDGNRKAARRRFRLR
jgi:two-component system, OmpR family, response regulator